MGHAALKEGLRTMRPLPMARGVVPQARRKARGRWVGGVKRVPLGYKRYHTLALMARTGQSHFYYFLSNILSWFWLPRVCNRTGALPDYKHFLTATKLDELVLLFYPH